MEVRFNPPRLVGSPEEKLKQLSGWVNELCERLNIQFEAIESKFKELEKK